MNKEFGSALCDKLSHMVWEGGKAAVGGCTGEVINKSHLVLPVQNWVQMPDDLMKQGAVMICAGMDLQLFYTVCTMM